MTYKAEYEQMTRFRGPLQKMVHYLNRVIQ